MEDEGDDSANEDDDNGEVDEENEGKFGDSKENMSPLLK